MTSLLVAWLVIVLVFIAIDAVWLGLVAKSFYQRELGHLMLGRPKLQIAVIFYLVYAIAILVLAAMPAAREGSPGLGFILGAVLGFAAYGTYDITNLSTLKNWPVTMSIVDMAWGTLLTAISATAGTIALTHLS
jgi:uncharacterized membrane protein